MYSIYLRGIIIRTPKMVPLILGNPNPYNPLYKPSFHFIFHVLFHLILHYRGNYGAGKSTKVKGAGSLLGRIQFRGLRGLGFRVEGFTGFRV